VSLTAAVPRELTRYHQPRALFGLYALIYGFSQITAGIQLRQLPADVDSLSELHDAAT
jgi:hypothetical protein